MWIQNKKENSPKTRRSLKQSEMSPKTQKSLKRGEGGWKGEEVHVGVGVAQDGRVSSRVSRPRRGGVSSEGRKEYMVERREGEGACAVQA